MAARRRKHLRFEQAFIDLLQDKIEHWPLTPSEPVGSVTFPDRAGRDYGDESYLSELRETNQNLDRLIAYTEKYGPDIVDFRTSPIGMALSTTNQLFEAKDTAHLALYALVHILQFPQQGIADELGISKGHVSHFQDTDKSIPVNCRKQLLALLDLTLLLWETFFGGEGPRPAGFARRLGRQAGRAMLQQAKKIADAERQELAAIEDTAA